MQLVPTLADPMLLGQVKGPDHVGKPAESWNDLVLCDIYHLFIVCPYQVAQDKSAWQAQTCSTRTQPWLPRISVSIINRF